jgi:hypothetical protein
MAKLTAIAGMFFFLIGFLVYIGIIPYSSEVYDPTLRKFVSATVNQYDVGWEWMKMASYLFGGSLVFWGFSQLLKEKDLSEKQKEEFLKNQGGRYLNKVFLGVLIFAVIFGIFNNTSIQNQGFKEFFLAVWQNPREHPGVLWILLVIGVLCFIQYMKWRTQRQWWALQGQFLANAEQQEQERVDRSIRSLRESRMLEMRERPRQKDTRGM